MRIVPVLTAAMLATGCGNSTGLLKLISATSTSALSTSTTASDGSSLDPTVSANQAAITANVAASLEKETITDAVSGSTTTTAAN